MSNWLSSGSSVRPKDPYQLRTTHQIGMQADWLLDSPYRLVRTPILNYVLQVEKENPGRQIAGLLPEMVERHWYHYLLHNQRAEILKT
jgi:hypothetical protein